MNYLRLVLALLVTVVTVAAQPPPDPPPPHSPDGEPVVRGPVDRWMSQMKQRHPEDFERLRQLRETDPDAFQAELHSRREQLRDRNLKEGMAAMPRFREMMEGLSPEERKRMGEKFSRMMRVHSKHRGPDNPEIAAGERKTQELAAAYRNAPPEGQVGIRVELRAQIERVFTLREAEHLRQIDEAEKHLQRLKDSLEKRSQARDAIVERRLKELTEGPQGQRPRRRHD